jgi:hypothetical protein
MKPKQRFSTTLAPGGPIKAQGRAKTIQAMRSWAERKCIGDEPNTAADRPSRKLEPGCLSFAALAPAGGGRTRRRGARRRRVACAGEPGGGEAEGGGERGAVWPIEQTATRRDEVDRRDERRRGSATDTTLTARA